MIKWVMCELNHYMTKKSYKSSKGTNLGIRKEKEDQGRLCEVC